MQGCPGALASPRSPLAPSSSRLVARPVGWQLPLHAQPPRWGCNFALGFVALTQRTFHRRRQGRDRINAVGRTPDKAVDSHGGDAAVDDLLAWAKGYGARGLDGFYVGQGGPGDRFGVFATRRFEDEEEVMSMPLAACVGKASAAATAAGPEEKEGDTMGMALARTLLAELQKGAASTFAPHLALLGRDCIPEQHPLMWAGQGDECRELTHALDALATSSPAAAHYLKDSADIARNAERRLGEDPALGSPGPNAARFAMAVVSSRTFLLEGALVLCPVLDFVNHFPGPGAALRADVDGDHVVMLANRNIEPGEELNLEYSQYTNLQLLCYYGFVPTRNAFDAVDVQLSTKILLEAPPDINAFAPTDAEVGMCGSLLKEAREAALHRRGWSDLAQPFCLRLPNDEGVAGRVMPVFRLLALESPAAIEASEASLFWMDGGGSLPAETGWELEARARLLQRRWLDGVLLQYKLCAAALHEIAATPGSRKEVAAGAAALAKVLSGEMSILAAARGRASAFCAAAAEVSSLRAAGDAIAAEERLQVLKERWWGDASGWMDEWSGWSGGRVPVV
mmetsp:Transcript_55788/g.155520  ORF Transcript_55788/g.155520 Transcript_55788/m.155520 type:complete len:568 (-) Transcript_55788:279-1982(-)